MMDFLKLIKIDVSTLEADDVQTIVWYIDASFAVYSDVKSHTGTMFTLGIGAKISSLIKQMTNSRSSTEADLDATDNMICSIV